jgi:ABC-type multidrug transport system fused ATPase/permease subunit
LEPQQPSWITLGAITLEHVSGEGLCTAVHGLNIEIKPMEKVGILGGDRSGKQLLMALLFRVHDATTGVVRIDGKDITRAGLRELRAAVAMVPAHPTLIQGTLRCNVDPLQLWTDQQVRDSLTAVGLDPSWIDREIAQVGRATGQATGQAGEAGQDEPHSHRLRKTNRETGEDGDDGDEDGDVHRDEHALLLSVSQRQLVSLARARLRSVRIVIIEVPEPSNLLAEIGAKDMQEGQVR